MRRIGPQPGPQEAFLSSSADIVIYGGAAGGGKSFGLLLESLRNSSVPGFYSVIFRQTYPDITNPGGLWDSSMEVMPYSGAVPKQSRLAWEWKSGARVQFSHFNHPKYKANWQGAQICLIGWDELTHFSRDIFFYMLSRNRSTCGVRPYIRCTCNPDPDSWVREFIDWWIDENGYPHPDRSGVVRWFYRDADDADDIVWVDSYEEVPEKWRLFAKSVTFIAANLSDNPALTRKDPSYMASLMALPKHERERLLGGNWNIKLSAGLMFRREWFDIVDASPAVGQVCRYWDRAATEPSETNADPDWTVGVKIRQTFDGLWYVEHVDRFRARPDGVRRRIKQRAQEDGVECSVILEEDPGQAGKADIDALTKYLAGYHVSSNRVTTSKEVRARPVSAQCEAGNVKLVRGDWNPNFLSELEQFPEGNHDDQVDAFSGAFNQISLYNAQPSVMFLGS